MPDPVLRAGDPEVADDGSDVVGGPGDGGEEEGRRGEDESDPDERRDGDCDLVAEPEREPVDGGFRLAVQNAG